MPNFDVYVDSGFSRYSQKKNLDPHMGSGYTFYQYGEEVIKEFLGNPSLRYLDKSQPQLIIDVAKKAVQLFGGNCLIQFVLANLQRGNFYTDLHFEFLKDTLCFIKTGKRDMSIDNWMNLLIDTKAGKRHPKKLQNNTTYSMTPDCYRGCTIQLWLSRENGIADLIKSLYIIFGKHNDINF